MKSSLNSTYIRYLAFWASVLSLLLGSTYMATAGEQKDIVDTAVSSGSLQTLAKALDAAGLVGSLKSKGPFTVFAPTDEAFAKLPPGTLQELLKPENKAKLQAILLYHVVPGRVLASQVATLKSAKTVNGESLTISSGGGSLTVGGAKIIKSDIVCSNGVVHVIDRVLLPQ